MYDKNNGKTGTFTAQNAMLDFNIMAESSGSPKEVATNTAKLTMPGVMSVKVGAETATLKGVIADAPVSVVGVAANGTMVQAFTKDSAAAEDKFSISGETLSLPTKPDSKVAEYVIKYERTVSSGVKVSNRADKFPRTIKLSLVALAVDPCSPDNLRKCYIVLPSFQVSPEVEISLNTDAQLEYKGNLQVAYCNTSGKILYEIYFAEEDIEE